MKKLLLFSMLIGALICAVGYAREHDSGEGALQGFYNADPGMSGLVGRAYAYAIFPDVGEGAFIVGGGGGKGFVYQGGKLVGTSKMGYVTFGAQVGGQGYQELIVFANEHAFRNFKDGKLKFHAGVAAVIAEAGAAQKAAFHEGVAVFIRNQKGAMLKAAIGGQGFSYHPIGEKDD